MRIRNPSTMWWTGRDKQTGLAALEFIICLPVLFILLVLLIDASRAFIQFTKINKALQNGARYAVLDTYGTLDFGSIAAVDKIEKVVIYGNPLASPDDPKILDYPDLVVSVTEPTETSKEVVVSANYTYEPIFSSSLAFKFGASSKMRTSP